MSLTTNLLRHWQSATPAHRRAGRAWYSNARALVREIACEHQTTAAIVAGVVAATSPRTTWTKNIAVTRGLLSGENVTGVFRTSIDKARRIIAGAKPLTVLGGNKCRAFYRALLGDRTAVVVDTWMVRACGMDPKITLTDRAYATIAAAIERVASELRIAAAELQAAIWVALRGAAV